MIIVLVVMLLFFLLGRELICWYFKMNKVVELLDSINEQLKNNHDTNKSH